MQVCMYNLRFSMNIWSITNECSRLITIWTTVWAYRTWADDVDCGIVNDVHSRMAWPFVYDASHWSYIKTNCPKNHLCIPIWRPLKIPPPKVERGTELLTLSKFTCQLARDIDPCQKIHVFPYRGFPWGATVPSYTFLESSRWAIWRVMLQLTVF